MADDFSEGFEAGWGAARAENIYSMEHDLAEALAERATPQPLAIGLDREGPGGWLIKDTLNGGWVWVTTRIAAVAALTEGRQIWSVDHGKYESACLPAAPTGGRS